MQIEIIRAGVVGYGIGKIYASALKSLNSFYPDLPPIELLGLATSTTQSIEEGKKRFGFAFTTNNYQDLLNHPEINLLVLAAPNDLHYEMALHALPGGKFILADKPLTLTLEQAEHLAQSAGELKRDIGVIFEFRHCPAIQLAKEMIASGKLGQIYSFRAEYYRSSYADPKRSLRWKSSAAKGGGVWNDLGPHIVDLVTWLIGVPQKVCAQQRIFIPTRPSIQAPDELIPVETDDHTLVMAQLADGGVGTFEVGRLISGAVNDIHLSFFGNQGSMRWSFMERDALYYSDRQKVTTNQAWQRILPSSRMINNDLPPADFGTDMFRYILTAIADYLQKAIRGQPIDPGLRQGAQVQAVIEAAQQSGNHGNWEDVRFYTEDYAAKARKS